ncbi:lanC-like protein 2 isoform X2 [Planococcus citri]
MHHRATFSDDKSFVNQLNDYVDGQSSNVQVENNKISLTPVFLCDLEKAIQSLYHRLDSNISNAFSYGEKIYTGFGGLSLLKLLNDECNKFHSKALDQADRLILETAQECRINDRISFLNGNAGILTIAALTYHKRGDQEKTNASLEKLLRFSKYCFASGRSPPPDELLYGRAGYLYALLLVRKHIPNDLIKDCFIKEVAEKIIDSGKTLSRATQAKTPLQYEWHDKEYIGAAHGYCGILHTLLLARQQNIISESTVITYVKPTIDYVLNMQFPSKNIPSSVNSLSGDKLVQWCHGAPGAVHMVALAYEVLKDNKYLQAALDFGEVTWQRGLLRKGYSLCHGVSGNGYTFIKLYQLTGDPKHLHRATKFAEWCFTYGYKQAFEPDRPNSLYEGLAGVIYFLVDLQQAEKAKFPGVEI